MHVSSTALGPAYSTGSDCWLTGRMCEQMENMSCGDKDIHGRCRDEQLQPRTVVGYTVGQSRQLNRVRRSTGGESQTSHTSTPVLFQSSASQQNHSIPV